MPSLSRQPALEHVGRLDEVVVDGDDRRPHRPGLRLREEEVLVHRFCHLGARFSAKAFGPSLASSDANTTDDSSLSIL